MISCYSINSRIIKFHFGKLCYVNIFACLRGIISFLMLTPESHKYTDQRSIERLEAQWSPVSHFLACQWTELDLYEVSVFYLTVSPLYTQVGQTRLWYFCRLWLSEICRTRTIRYPGIWGCGGMGCEEIPLCYLSSPRGHWGFRNLITRTARPYYLWFFSYQVMKMLRAGLRKAM